MYLIWGESMYQAVRAGNCFASVCKTGGSGYIHSIFDKTINIDLKERNAGVSLFTLARSDVDETPATLVTSMQSNESWYHIGAKVGDTITFTSSAVYLGKIKLIDGISNATIWQAKTSSVLQELPSLTYEEIKLRCDKVALFVKTNGKNQSVYPLITRFSEIFDRSYMYDTDPFLQQFLHGVLTLHNAFSCTSGNFQSISDFDLAAKMLLGLGDGLTPSGDDFLAGLLFAVHFVQKVFARKCDVLPIIIHAMCENMEERTNRISRHFLRCAADGQWGRVTEDFMVALFKSSAQHNDELYRTVDKKLSYGATSGMDEIFGIMFGVCEAVKIFK